jgi:hypothetical protein
MTHDEWRGWNEREEHTVTKGGCVGDQYFNKKHDGSITDLINIISLITKSSCNYQATYLIQYGTTSE